MYGSQIDFRLDPRRGCLFCPMGGFGQGDQADQREKAKGKLYVR